ncbi:hypothetical protein BZA05DRAFT_156335 [Tricharina praecox]|uniref:uncharacterized protein n=1 Tax=Tricharina praecox TaxID=43433 RepID=UPI00221FF694|nr:uncharacterized protein BZA05DRAFT_156335 [Tricharina praecox]KAI5844717.1 hypothetical protein BZA05DRAFT_156335 [Tricharina praecox]
MPTSLATLPLELWGEIFTSFDHLESATRLASTCHLANSVWLLHRRTLCTKLVFLHPLIETPAKSRCPIVELSLWDEASELERVQRDSKDNEDYSTTCRRILTSARAVRRAAIGIKHQLTEYFDTTLPFGHLHRGGKMWGDYSVYAISRILYKLLIRLERREEISIRNEHCLGITCAFASYHQKPFWQFPDVSRLLVDVNPRRLDLISVEEWVPVVWAIEEEFERLDELYYVDE